MSQTYHIRVPFGERNETHIPIQRIEELERSDYLSLPQDFFMELARFVRRNRIKCTPHPDQVCLRCLKAHARWLLDRNLVEDERKKLFLSLFDCKTGHNGYYQDKHLVRKL